MRKKFRESLGHPPIRKGNIGQMTMSELVEAYACLAEQHMFNMMDGDHDSPELLDLGARILFMMDVKSHVQL